VDLAAVVDERRIRAVAQRARRLSRQHGSRDAREQFALRGLFDSGRKVLAGVLLLLPGVISDVMALVLLALPLNVGHGLEPQSAHPYRRGRQRAFDGDFRRVE
jgi:UPF0716 family protein affecting phage T7 exclusion